MKKFYVLIMAFALTALALQSCDKDDNVAVPQEVQSALIAKYPAASQVEWEVKNGYYVADFVASGAKTSAWFNSAASWELTDTNIPFASLPQAVKDAFLASKYAAWKVDEVERIERKAVEVVYLIEVEQGEVDVDLYYSEDGVLVKELVDVDNSHIVQPNTGIPAEIQSFISSRYPNARIVEAEAKGNGTLEVDFIHENRGKEAAFNSQRQWISTTWEVRSTELPAAVISTLQLRYGGYNVDDVDFVETPQVSYYLIELEKGSSEVVVKMDSSGAIL